MDILFITVGKTKTGYLKTGINEYLGRLDRYTPFSMIELPDIKSGKGLTEEQIKQKEGLLILDKILPSDFIVLLDEKGREYSSEEFADYIQKMMGSGRKRSVFIVGGPYGFSNDVYMRADAKLSLSRMTFNHEMVRLFFVEQVYRAMTILRGEPYHHR